MPQYRRQAGRYWGKWPAFDRVWAFPRGSGPPAAAAGLVEGCAPHHIARDGVMGLEGLEAWKVRLCSV